MVAWRMVIHVDRESGDVTLETPLTETGKRPLMHRQVVPKSELKTTFHVYDLDKFSHLLTLDEGFVFHTWLRVKTPRVIRMLAVCARHDHGFSCVLANGEDVQRARHHPSRCAKIPKIDLQAFQHMPKGTDIQKIQDEFARVVNEDIIS
jgi:hypothetical protein